MVVRLTIWVATLFSRSAFEILFDEIAELEEFDLPLGQVADPPRLDEAIAVIVKPDVMQSLLFDRVEIRRPAAQFP